MALKCPVSSHGIRTKEIKCCKTLIVEQKIEILHRNDMGQNTSDHSKKVDNAEEVDGSEVCMEERVQGEGQQQM